MKRSMAIITKFHMDAVVLNKSTINQVWHIAIELHHEKLFKVWLILNGRESNATSKSLTANETTKRFVTVQSLRYRMTDVQTSELPRSVTSRMMIRNTACAIYSDWVGVSQIIFPLGRVGEVITDLDWFPVPFKTVSIVQFKRVAKVQFDA